MYIIAGLPTLVNNPSKVLVIQFGLHDLDQLALIGISFSTAADNADDLVRPISPVALLDVAIDLPIPILMPGPADMLAPAFFHSLVDCDSALAGQAYVDLAIVLSGIDDVV